MVILWAWLKHFHQEKSVSTHSSTDYFHTNLCFDLILIKHVSLVRLCRRLTLAVRQGVHVAIRLHASPVRSRRRPSSSGRRLHEQFTRYVQILTVNKGSNSRWRGEQVGTLGGPMITNAEGKPITMLKAKGGVMLLLLCQIWWGCLCFTLFLCCSFILICILCTTVW